MITKYSIKLIILLIIIGLLISGFLVFGLILIGKFFLNYDLFIGLTGVLFIWMGLGYYTLIAGSIKSIEFHNGLLIIRKPLLHRYYEIELTKIKYIEFEWQSSWSTMKGLLIQLDNDIVEKISFREYCNSKDFIELIINSCKRDDKIKVNIWTKSLKTFILTGLIITISFVLLKVLN